MSDGFRSRRILTEVEVELPPRPTLPNSGPDQPVIVACSKFVEIEVRRRRLLKLATTVSMEEECQREIASTDEDFAQALDRLCLSSASTLDGLRAKAYALTVYEPDFIVGNLEGSVVGGRVLASLLTDILAEPTSRPKRDT